MSKFRQSLRAVLKRKGRRYQGSAGEAAREHRSRLIELFVSGDDIVAKVARFIFERLLNGDWTNTDEVQHMCNNCCTSDDDFVEKLLDLGVWVFAAAAPMLFPRNRWVGADKVPHPI